VRARVSDLDIVSVQFEFKKAEDATWTSMGAPVTRIPYTGNLDPAALGMSYGDYHLRTVARQGRQYRPRTAAITVTLRRPDTSSAPSSSRR